MEKNIRPLILVSNDDSIEANGVHALIDVLVNFGDVVAVCPAHPQSGQSMALTVATPLRITRVEDYKDAKMYKGQRYAGRLHKIGYAHRIGP